MPSEKQYITTCIQNAESRVGTAVRRLANEFPSMAGMFSIRVLDHLSNLAPYLESDDREDVLREVRELASKIHKLDMAEKLSNTTGRTEAEAALYREKAAQLRGDRESR